MAMWPFKRRRRGASPIDEKTRPTQPETSTATFEPKTSALPRSAKVLESTSLPRAAIPNKEKMQMRPTSPRQSQSPAKPPVDLEKRPTSESNKENAPAGYTSREDITALPEHRHLDRSPHLRAVDQERARIPYNFRPYSTSQTSLQETEALGSLHRPNTRFSERTHTLRSKRSATDTSGLMRKSSSRKDKRRDERVREEEIRQLASSSIPIPKRAGDGPLRKDSKKFRGTNFRDSNVSLPAEGSIHSSMSGAREQRGWEVGTFDMFNPRPAVRLSGTPQYVIARDSRAFGSGMLYTIESRAGKAKTPTSRGSNRNERTVGDEADELGSGDLRMIMEREAKRKQRRDQERQEKLDRKLRGRVARDRADSEKKRRDAASDRRLEDARLRAAEQIQARQPVAPPAAIHPALRGDTVMTEDVEPVGLGIGDRAQPPSQTPHDEETDDPFSDAQEHLHTPPMQDSPTVGGAQGTPDTPFEDAVVQTATAVRLSQAYTPPLSPVYSRGAAQISTTQLTDTARQPSTSYQSTSHYSMQSVSDLTKPPPINTEPRRSSDTPKDRRTGSTWATIFRRPSAFRKSQNTGKQSPAELSFSNTSRDSMRNQPIPAHLIDPQASRPPTQPRAFSLGGTPARTQSRFHEDLPGMPISPPDSRTQSPDVPITAAVAVTQRSSGRLTPQQPIDMLRTDTPTSSQNRGPKVSTSLASIDSEGSWLASGSMKRASHQSALSRNLGSKRNRELASPSYEDLAGADGAGHTDQDAEYLARNSRRKGSNTTPIGATPDEESEDEAPTLAASTLAASTDPALTVHGSARRRPTLVQRDERLKSREGLVSEYLSSSNINTSGGAGANAASYHATFENSHDVSSLDSDDELDSPVVEVERATSVHYGSRHSRQFSAGSARLLDVKSGEPGRERTPTPTMGMRGDDAIAGAER